MRRPPYRGFILVTVLWFLLGLTIAAAALAAWVARSVDQATLIRDQHEALRELHSTRQTFIYLATTRPSRVSGLYMGTDLEVTLNAWRLDPFAGHSDTWSRRDLPLNGSPLRGIGGSVFSVQDEAGLLNPHLLGAQELEAVLRFMGVPGTERRQLVRSLQQQTRDAWAGRGAVRFRQGQGQTGSAAPVGRNLLSPLEVFRIEAWRSLGNPNATSQWRDGVTVLYEGLININTVPDWMLPAAPGMTTADAAQVLRVRQAQPMTSGLRLSETPGHQLDFMIYRATPSQFLRLDLRHPEISQGRRYHLHLTPFANGERPWRVELTYPLTRLSDHDRPVEDSPRRLAHPLLATSPDP